MFINANHWTPKRSESKQERARFLPGVSEKNCEQVVASEILNSPQFTIKQATISNFHKGLIVLYCYK